MTEISPNHRFFGIEEVPELQCSAPDQTFTLTTDTVSIRDLVRTAMRAFADRILIGEARGGEMLNILQAWNRTRGGSGDPAQQHDNARRRAGADRGLDQHGAYSASSAAANDRAHRRPDHLSRLRRA